MQSNESSSLCQTSSTPLISSSASAQDLSSMSVTILSILLKGGETFSRTVLRHSQSLNS